MNRAVVAAVLVIASCNSRAAPESRAAPAGSAAARPPGLPGTPGTPLVPPGVDVGRLDGKPLYLAVCAPCHGADAKGYAADHAPSLVNPTFLESASDEFLRLSIATGRPGTSMAAYGTPQGGPLDPAAIGRLVGYLRAQGPPARALPAVAAGDAATGAAVYAKRCLACHGDGGTRGEAISLTNPWLQQQASDAFLRHAIVHGRPGTKMEAFAGALSDREIDGVIGYLRSLGGRAPEIAMLPEPTGKEPLVLSPSGKAPAFSLRADPCPPLPPGAVASCTPDPRFVSVDQVAAALAAKQRLVIIDARPASEWRRVHIAGAVSIPYLDMKRLDEVPTDGTWVIAYCACPHHLSGIVVDELRRRGHAHSAVLDEGINDWHRRGFPVVAAEGVPQPPAEPAPPPGTIR